MFSYDDSGVYGCHGVGLARRAALGSNVNRATEEGLLRIVGRRAWKQPEGWTSLHRESADVPFELVLEHENAIDTEKVSAELRDGVLRIALPKSEAVKPRKIAVT